MRDEKSKAYRGGGRIGRAAGAVVERLEGRMLLDSKLDDGLSQLYAEYETWLADPQGQFEPADSYVPFRGDYVVIDAIPSGTTSQLQSDLEAIGMIESEAAPFMVSGLWPIDQIPDLEDLASLQAARTAYVATHVGAVTTQGDAAMLSDYARANFGVDGTGVTVGVLSDSFDGTGAGGGYAADITSGDLPNDVNVLDDTGVQVIDEGRAMLQIVHDVAPGAGLAFHTAWNGQAGFAQGIRDLADAGANVIVDDIIYFHEPMFQDGVIAQAVDEVVADGVGYFSAAGNQGTASHESVYRAGTTYAPGAFGAAFRGGTAHDFDPGAGVDNMQQFTLGYRQTVLLSFQWDEPFFSVSGGVGSTIDMDLYVLNANQQVVASARSNNIRANGGSGDPVEVVGFTSWTYPTATYHLMLVRYDGGDPGRVKYVDFRSANMTEWVTASATCYGHANAAGAEALGAAEYADTPEFGVNPPVAEPFTSRGGTPILFDVDGNRLGTPEARNKPRITAPDGVHTTFFHDDEDEDGVPDFFGTSAAAPHAAAVAALMRQANPSLTPAQIYAKMEQTALDMGDTGFDNDSGYGLIQADGAVAASLMNLDEATGELTVTGTSGADTISASVADGKLTVSFNGATVKFNWNTVSSLVINSGSGNDNVSVAPSVTAPVTINGGGGNDTVTAVQGNDSIVGGAGNDTYVFGSGAFGTVHITEEANGGTDTLDFYGFGQGVSVYLAKFGTEKAVDILGVLTLYLSDENSIENVKGSNNTSTGDSFHGNSQNNTFWGNGGNDAFFGGADTGTGADVFYGGAGVDTADYSQRTGGVGVSLDNNANDGAAGEYDNVHSDIERIIAGSGNDTLFGTAAPCTLAGGDGNDVLAGGSGNDELWAGPGNDTVYGGIGHDTIYGEEGTDYLDGGAEYEGYGGYGGYGDYYGNDSIEGGDDSDAIYGDYGNDLLFGESEEASTGAADYIRGEDGNDTIFGGPGNDSAYGGYGNDDIYGEDGDDTIQGDDGNDTITGGNGTDYMYGDAGDDQFRSRDDLPETIYGGSGNDSFLESDQNDVLI